MKSKLLLFISTGILGSLVLVALVASLTALNPSDLFQEIAQAPEPTAVKLAEPPAQEAPPEPPSKAAEANLLASLAPDSFSNNAPDMGGGVSFGSGGFGPAVGGGGGFGTDARQLVQDKSSLSRPPRVAMRGTLEYPSDARKKSVSGFVVLKILVGLNGQVEDVQVEESEPKGFFDQAAIKSVKSWKFEPALIKGQTASAWTAQKIKFELN